MHTSCIVEHTQILAYMHAYEMHTYIHNTHIHTFMHKNMHIHGLYDARTSYLV